MASIRYMVDDVDAAVAFYTGRLGFEVKDHRGAPFASVRKGDLTLWLAGPRSSAARPMTDGRQPAPGGWNRLVLEVPDIEAVVAELRANNCAFRNEIVAGPGGKQILCEDPSGNPIEIFQPA